MYRVRFSKTAARAVKRLHPDLKKAAKMAVRELAENPYIGKEFQHELSGYHSHRFRRYRIVYKLDTRKKILIFLLLITEKTFTKFFQNILEVLEIVDSMGVRLHRDN